MRAGIIGGASLIERANTELSVEEAVFYTVKQGLESIGWDRSEVQTVVQCADDVLDGISINHVYQVEAAGSFLKDESKVERDGAWGAMYAMAKILTGKFQTAMVVAYSKCNQVGYSAFTGMNADPFFLRPVGVDGDGLAGLQARHYMQASGASEADLAAVTVKNRLNASRNPRAMAGEGAELDTEAVLASPFVAEPIRELDCAQAGDGCVVLFLASDDYIKSNKLDASYIRSVGFASDRYYPTFRKLDRVESARVAVEKATTRAGLNPADVDFAEVHECYGYQELMLYESLGLVPEGHGLDFLRQGASQKEGRLPVNASGGALGSHIPYAAGLMRMLEAHLQIQGRAGTNQLGKADLALVHGQAGLAMQSNIAFFLER